MLLDENDPRITAYALGEMEDAEVEGFEEKLANDPEARRQVEEIREAAALLKSELQAESAPELTAAERSAVEEKLREIEAKGSRSREVVAFRIPLYAKRTWRLIAANALAASLLATAIALPVVWSIMSDEPPDISKMPEAGKAGDRDRSLPAIVQFNVPAPQPDTKEEAKTRGVTASAEALSEREQRAIESLGYIDPPDGMDYQPEAGGLNTESYDRIDENPFLAVSQNPLSTFSIDVDTASYSNVRRILNSGSLPPRDAVRIEELVNYFEYDYPEPTGDDPFSVNVDVASAPWAPSHRLARIGLKGREVPVEERRGSNLVFLIDVSGSMTPQDKLPLLQRGLRFLVDQLREDDRVAIVVYAGSSGLVLPSTAGSQKEQILRAIERLEAGGSTNGGSGIKLAYDIASESFIDGGINRVILATDGDFNVGVTNQGDLTRLIEQEASRGVFLTVLGFGTENYKDSTLEKLADRGNGNYAYIDTCMEARKVLGEQAASTILTIAKDVKLQVEFNPQQVALYRLLGYENRALRAEDFNDDTKDAGEIGSGHTVTALYELIPPGQTPPEGGAPDVDALRYQRPATPAGAAGGGELLTVKLRYKAPDSAESRLIVHHVRDGGMTFEQSDDDLRFAAAVAAFGMILRDSPHKGTATLEAALAWAEENRGPDNHGYRAGFIELVKVAQSLKRG